ncbi:MAG: hypothetical protein CVV49_03875 [Spirochaetae bacterium HGW-Spirochaetae-5]|nr:MAG: hypothetical protein CVV49_03875 [Spirochaetae bacterium HGW-Spirochaetae-5]
MKLKSIIYQLILAFILLFTEGLSASAINLNENNSNILASQISSELIKNPVGDNTPFYLRTLMELAPVMGRDKISKVFKDAAAKIDQESVKGKLYSQILQYSLNELNVSQMRSEKNFTILKKWNLSGPWKRYGRGDIDYRFTPETVYKMEEIEKGFNQSVDRMGKIFPFRTDHSGDETYYAACSFSDSGTGVVLWIDSDAEYKLLVNGKELDSTVGKSGHVIKAYSLRGAGGYTVQIKMQSGEPGSYPYIRGMVTDDKHNLLRLTYSSIIYNYNFITEKLYSSDEPAGYFSGEAPVMTENLRKLIHSGDYAGGYMLGSALIEKYPLYFPVYKEFIPLLDKMDRDEEFQHVIGKFIKNFPHADIHSGWLADFYMTRDKGKFKRIITTAPVSSLSRNAIESYIYLLCGDSLFNEALELCHSMGSDPFFSRLVPEIIRASGNDSGWRKSLIDRAALNDDAALYYSLGLAEMKRGLDPVMYWEKSYSLDGNPGLMRDLSDIFENSIIASNDIYNGVYTDHHPEFGWNGKKRKISIHVFESGRVLLEGEDTVPPGRKLHGEKISEGGIEFSSGEIRTDLPYVDGLKILYVLTAKDGLPVPINFESGPVSNNRVTLKYNCSGEEEFSVIKYSAELPKDQSDPFKMLKNLVLKSAGENISWLEYEVVLHGGLVPVVSYNGKPLSESKREDGRVRYSVKERFSKNGEKSAVTGISRFSSDAVFAEWYRGLLNYSERPFPGSSIKFSDKDSFEDIIGKVHLYILSTVSKTGSINFNPGEIDYRADNIKGTVEERTHLAKAILQSRGIKSYIAFRKNSAGLIDKILLYVPENMGRDYWLNFYGDGISDKMETGSVAIVITGEGYNTIPVNPETCIR